ncbi:MAG: winged helix-turn-helix transcriptional regulator [Archaeoglobaceae archaeon]|nr:winged helix-turn-helix transcriptional regulator [Archaeoglobaceae archaeon]
MKKRDRLEIIHDILKIIKDHGNLILPTPLLRFSNLSTQNFNKYISELLKKGLIEEKYDKNRKYYSLTEKGFEFLRKYKNIREFMEEFGL